MNLSKKNIEKILGIITFAIVIFTLSQNLSVVGTFFSGVLTICAPLIVGCCLAFILNIPLNALENTIFKGMKKSNKKAIRKAVRPLSLILTVILTVGFFALLLFTIIPQLRDSVLLIVNRVPVYYKELVEWIDSIILRFGLDINTEILHNPRINIDTIVAMAQKVITFETTNTIVNTTVGVTTSVISGIVNFALGSIIAVYILAEKEKIGNFTNRLSEKLMPKKVYDKFLEVSSVTHSSFSNFISGQFTDAFILAVLCFIGMSIFRFPNAAVISVIIGITAIIPVIGPLIGEFIGCFIIFMESPLQALFFLIFVLILQAVDNNFIYPKIVGKSVGLPGIIVLVAVIIGGNLGGILGILLGVPLSSAIYALVVSWLRKPKEETTAEENEAVEEKISE